MLVTLSWAALTSSLPSRVHSSTFAKAPAPSGLTCSTHDNDGDRICICSSVQCRHIPLFAVSCVHAQVCGSLSAWQHWRVLAGCHNAQVSVLRGGCTRIPRCPAVPGSGLPRPAPPTPSCSHDTRTPMHQSNCQWSWREYSVAWHAGWRIEMLAGGLQCLAPDGR